jgi:1-aminocyclopropane-1-carboxylate deaminase
MTARDLDAMRAANAAFRAALSAGDLDGALEADARFHRVALDVCANAAAAAVIARYEPVLRRVERLRFASDEAAASAERHDRLVRGGRRRRRRPPRRKHVAIPHHLARSDRTGPRMKLHEFPRHPLTFGPSPLQHLARLSDHLGGAQIWAKREDVNSGLAFGGNKVRKLEYIVPDILASGADTIVSIGGYQSNHTRQVAAVAAHLGLKARLVQEKWVPWDDPTNDKVGNILLAHDGRGFAPRRCRLRHRHPRLVEAGAGRGRSRGGTPYPIPAGASEHPLGGLGFANWAFEVAEQEKQLGVFFDTIIVCTVTGSTHAGMIAGFAALEEATGVRRRVLGIDASATLQKTRDQVARIARHTAQLIELGRDLRDDEIQVLEGGRVSCTASPSTRRWRPSNSAHGWKR